MKEDPPENSYNSSSMYVVLTLRKTEEKRERKKSESLG